MPMPRGFHGPYILDEFTFLPVSDRRRSMLRNRRDGKCMDCGVPSAPYSRCPYHTAKQREYQRRYSGARCRYLNAKSYRRTNERRTTNLETGQLP